MRASNNLNKERIKKILPVIKEWCENEEAELYYDGYKATWLSFDYPSELWEVEYPKKTIVVNGVEVPAPEKKEPKHLQIYFVPDVNGEDFYINSSWYNDEIDNIRLERGLVYLNKEDAIARAKAILLFKEK